MLLRWPVDASTSVFALLAFLFWCLQWLQNCGNSVHIFQGMILYFTRSKWLIAAIAVGADVWVCVGISVFHYHHFHSSFIIVHIVVKLLEHSAFSLAKDRKCEIISATDMCILMEIAHSASKVDPHLIVSLFHNPRMACSWFLRMMNERRCIKFKCQQQRSHRNTIVLSFPGTLVSSSSATKTSQSYNAPPLIRLRR